MAVSSCLLDVVLFFVLSDTATTEIYTLSLHDALPILKHGPADVDESTDTWDSIDWLVKHVPNNNGRVGMWGISDRKSTRLNSSHANISYAVFCLKKKNQTQTKHGLPQTHDANLAAREV